MIVIVDNYDSFTYNLVDLVKRFVPVQVFRNDEISVDELVGKSPSGILISPGPGNPDNSGISRELVDRIKSEIPVLGVCLGHQIIGSISGAEVVKGSVPVHGKTSEIRHQNGSIFRDLPNPMTVMRYHSLVIDPAKIPNELEVLAKTDTEEIMGIRHKIYNLVGVQFHPESILSESGELMIRNWLEDVGCLPFRQKDV
ncbi:aminodeoxychorismate/anthranilate synthase component II [Pontibacter sp. G13]|uniref:anthranilate synthase component II n=1 Tax=Pontibacter sp. G13 TaxID=3074898 RepID=UPI00288A9004|nr:aminodeoxychorismate/anthranilate synthase component II [Pontibacter sp. G13]WNJ16496.1 aminodeoxychorismate/anthranilate synthase component II [Pontibacter sp. G13]